MSSSGRSSRRERVLLVADAFFLTTVVTAALLGLVSLLVEEVGDSGWFSWISSLMILGAVLVVLDVDAVRDLARQGAHRALDLARLGATLVAAATTAVALWYASAHPGQEPAELLAFGMAAGCVGGTVALGADLVAAARDRRNGEPTPSAPHRARA